MLAGGLPGSPYGEKAGTRRVAGLLVAMGPTGPYLLSVHT